MRLDGHGIVDVAVCDDIAASRYVRECFNNPLFHKDDELAYPHNTPRRRDRVAFDRQRRSAEASRVVRDAAQRMSAARAATIWAVLAAVVALLFVASLSIGSVPMSPWQALASLVPHGGDALFADIVRGVARHRERLDETIAASLSEEWPLRRLETILRLILEAGAYELAHRPDVPPRVTLSEYVAIAHAFFDGKEPGLANGVLNRLARALRADEL